MKLFSMKRAASVFAVVIGLMVATLVLAACGDKVDATTVSGQISMQPGATWQFQGKVEAIGSPWWTVGQQRILVNETTTVDSNPAPVVGSNVSIQGRTAEGGVLTASIIKVVISLGVPTVTPSGTNSPGAILSVSPSPATTTTVTTTPAATTTVAPTSTVVPTATAAPPATSTPAPTATVAPGTIINIIGVIQQITINNNQTIIVVDNRQYILSPTIVAIIKPKLVVGLSIHFVGRFDEVGQIIIINVTQINNQVIVINPPAPVKVDDDEDGKDHKSNGNCEGHSNGNCQGDKDKGKDKDKGGKPKK